MDLPDKMTCGELYGPAMEIAAEPEAQRYLAAMVARTARMTGKPPDEASSIERRNLGYYAGYYDNATRERVERLFGCEHPVFGGIAKHGPPTPSQAFELGVAIGKATTP